MVFNFPANSVGVIPPSLDGPRGTAAWNGYGVVKVSRCIGFSRFNKYAVFAGNSEFNIVCIRHCVIELINNYTSKGHVRVRSAEASI